MNSLSTVSFMLEKEPSVVKLVRNAIEENGKDDSFINDGDIEVFDGTSEEEEMDYDSTE